MVSGIDRNWVGSRNQHRPTELIDFYQSQKPLDGGKYKFGLVRREEICGQINKEDI